MEEKEENELTEEEVDQVNRSNKKVKVDSTQNHEVVMEPQPDLREDEMGIANPDADMMEGILKMSNNTSYPEGSMEVETAKVDAATLQKKSYRDSVLSGWIGEALSL